MNPTLFFLGISGLIFYWMVLIYKPFLLDMAIAVLLAISTAAFHRYLNRKSGRPLLSTFAVTLAMTLVFFGPLLYFILSTAALVKGFDLQKLTAVKQALTSLMQAEALDFLRPYLSQWLGEINLAKASEQALSLFGNLGARTALFVKDMVLILIFFFFAHLYGERIISFLKRVLPLEAAKAEVLFGETSRTMSVVISSILITAVFEGALFALIAGVYGYDPLLFGILYGFASLVPVIGGVAMWGPIALYELSQGNGAGATVIALYSVVVISVVADTFIKPVIIEFVNNRLVGVPSSMNSIVLFFAIVAGLSTFGFWGAVLGPAVTAMFIALLTVYGTMNERTSSNGI